MTDKDGSRRPTVSPQPVQTYGNNPNPGTAYHGCDRPLGAPAEEAQHDQNVADSTQEDCEGEDES